MISFEKDMRKRGYVSNPCEKCGYAGGGQFQIDLDEAHRKGLVFAKDDSNDLSLNRHGISEVNSIDGVIRERAQPFSVRVIDDHFTQSKSILLMLPSSNVVLHKLVIDRNFYASSINPAEKIIHWVQESKDQVLEKLGVNRKEIIL